MRSRPLVPSDHRRADATASSIAARAGRNFTAKSAPAGVNATFRVLRMSNDTPSDFSSCLMLCDSAGWEMNRISDALRKLSSVASTANARSCCCVASNAAPSHPPSHLDESQRAYIWAM